MENTNTTIKQKQLQFTHKDIEFKVQTIYDTSNFSVGNLSFWKFRVIKVDNQFLDTPLEYKYIQNRRWLNQIPKFRKHSFYCSSSRKLIEDKTNIYKLIKQETIYLYFNQRAIAKYKLQVDNFNSIIQKKYQHQLEKSREQKRVLKHFKPLYKSASICHPQSICSCICLQLSIYETSHRQSFFL